MLRLERRLERERCARQEAETIAEEGLRSLYDANTALDLRILERTAELHRALALAEAANNAKSSFLGQMSHQINTPLNGLLGMLELLGHELCDRQVIEWHASATRSARRLERLTTRLITYVELENVDLTGKGEPRPLSEVLASVHDRWHTPCLRAGQLLSVELLPGTEASVPGSKEVDLLLDELLSNVVEHSGPGAITVLGRVDESTAHAVVEVRDAGLGIDPELIEQPHNLDAAPNQTQLADAQINLGFALIDRIVTSLKGGWGLLSDGQPGVFVRLPTADQPG